MESPGRILHSSSQTSAPASRSGSVALTQRTWAGEGGSMKRTRRPRPACDDAVGFAGFRFPPEVILLAVRWYLRYGLSGTVALSHRATPAPQDVRPNSAIRAADRAHRCALVVKRVNLGPAGHVSQEDLPSRDHLNAQRNSALGRGEVDPGGVLGFGHLGASGGEPFALAREAGIADQDEEAQLVLLERHCCIRRSEHHAAGRFPAAAMSGWSAGATGAAPAARRALKVVVPARSTEESAVPAPDDRLMQQCHPCFAHSLLTRRRTARQHVRATIRLGFTPSALVGRWWDDITDIGSVEAAKELLGDAGTVLFSLEDRCSWPGQMEAVVQLEPMNVESGDDELSE
jgi:hypothetical protein